MNGFGTAILGGVTDFLGSIFNNSMAAERESTARRENYEYSEKAAQNADARTRALYNDLQSPKALLQQIQDAGLSPSLMFGGGGIGGATPTQGAQGSGASGISPTSYGINPIDAANVAVMQAQARKLNAETDDIRGETTEAQARIKKLIAETNNTDLNSEYQALENEWQQFENAIKGATANNVIAISDEQYKQAIETTKQFIATTEKLQAEGKISKETANDIIQQCKDKTLLQQAQILQTQANTQLAKSNIRLNDTQCKKLLNDIIVDNEAIKLQGDSINIDRDKLHEQVKQWAKENGFKKVELATDIANVIVNLLKAQTNGVTGLVALLKLLPK